jgi:hypothetical protein
MEIQRWTDDDDQALEAMFWRRKAEPIGPGLRLASSHPTRRRSAGAVAWRSGATARALGGLDHCVDRWISGCSLCPD